MVSNIEQLDLGTLLKIFSTKGVYNNLSDNTSLWDDMKKRKVAVPEGREVRYSLRKAYGAGAAQFVAVGGGAYPLSHKGKTVEPIAKFKDFAVTIEIERTLLGKSGSELARYGEPLAEELNAKGIVIGRMLSASILGDGSGAIGVVASTAVVNGRLVITLDTSSANAGRSHIGWFMEEDFVKVAKTDTTPQDASVSSGSIAYYKVMDIEHESDKVTIAAFDASDTELTIDGADEITSADVIYRDDRQSTASPDLTSIVDYRDLSFVWPGLESLTASDNRVVNGMVMGGVLAGTRKDCGGEAIDPSHFQELLSKGKRRCGKARYKYKTARMFDTVYDSLIEARESDRRFMTAKDATLGTEQLVYMHGKTTLALDTDEFVQKSRTWIVPEGSDALQYRGTDVAQVEPNPGQKFHLAPNAQGGYNRTNMAFMEGSGLMFSKHPAAILVLTNFTA